MTFAATCFLFVVGGVVLGLGTAWFKEHDNLAGFVILLGFYLTVLFLCWRFTVYEWFVGLLAFVVTNVAARRQFGARRLPAGLANQPDQPQHL